MSGLFDPIKHILHSNWAGVTAAQHEMMYRDDVGDQYCDYILQTVEDIDPDPFDVFLAPSEVYDPTTLTAVFLESWLVQEEDHLRRIAWMEGRGVSGIEIATISYKCQILCQFIYESMPARRRKLAELMIVSCVAILAADRSTSRTIFPD